MDKNIQYFLKNNQKHVVERVFINFKPHFPFKSFFESKMFSNSYIYKNDLKGNFSFNYIYK